MKYDKAPLTIEMQIELLRNRGLNIGDESRIKKHLSYISYYRLSAYMLPFKKTDASGGYLEDFKDDTNWDDIHRLYLFDRKLRLLVFDEIERIEIAIRTQIIYTLSHKYGSHWQDIREIFKVQERRTKDGNIFSEDVYDVLQKHIQNQLRSNKAEGFIKHYKTKYTEPTNPPSWMSLEIMYFSHLSQICSGLANRKDIVAIAYCFSLPPDEFCSWLHTINYIRNLGAHHARLWNRDLSIIPKKLKFSKNLLWISNPDKAQRGKLYYFLCIVNYFLQTIIPNNNSYKSKLINLLDEYKDIVNVGYMGFPNKWRQEAIWKIN